MSMRYRGGFISATLPTVTGQQITPGVWTLAQQLQYQAAGNWPQQLPATWANAGVFSGSAGTIPSSIRKVIQDSSGNSYFLSGASANSAYLAKFNPDGTKAWENTYGLFAGGVGGPAYFIDGVFDSSGNLNLAFGDRAFSNYVVGFAKISPSGAVIAIKSYDFGAGQAFFGVSWGGCIAIDSSDNVYLTGIVITSGERRGFVLKASGSTLNLLWCVGTYGASGVAQGDTGMGIALTPDQASVYVTGYSQVGATPSNYLSRLAASSGSLLNSYQYTISGQSSFTAGPLAIDASGNIYITGRTASNNYFFGKLNSSLTPQWGFSIAVTANITSPNLGVSVGADGNIYFQSIGGITSDFSLNSLLARVSPSGTLAYTRNTTSYAAVSVPSVGDAVVYLANLNDVSGTRVAQYQRMPADGGGTSVYANAAGTYYYNYGFGPTLASATLSVTSATQFSSTLTPSTYTYSGVGPGASSSTYTRTTFTSPRIPGSALYSLPGTYSWIAPTGVTSVSVLAIGGGGGGGGYASGGGGGGGGLGYSNSQAVTPGTAYTVVVGSGGTGGTSNPSANGTAGGTSFFINASTVAGNGGSRGTTSSGGGTGGAGGSRVGAGGGDGGAGGSGSTAGGGGGGAGGYAGNGGAGGTATGGSSPVSGAAGSGGGGGGGQSGVYQTYYYCCGGVDVNYTPGQSGGNVGMAGQGANGAINGGSGSPSVPFSFGRGGGGGGVFQYFFPCCGGVNFSFSDGSGGQSGAVRILWGAGRSFPTTSVGAP
jgi:hypothetical protein